MVLHERSLTGHHFEFSWDEARDRMIWIKVEGLERHPEAYCLQLQDQLDFMIARILDPPPILPLPPPMSIWQLIRENLVS